MDDVRAHELTADAESADLILAVGEWVPQIEILTRNPMVTAFRSKCAVYYDNDGVIPIVPGVYASAVEGLHSRLGIVKNFCYAVALGKMRNRGLDEPGGAASEKRWLFSFKGGSTSLLRKRLFRTEFGRADVLSRIRRRIATGEDDQGNRLERQRSYARTLRESHFALCPRGAGAGSIRFFESMEMGVAPVLLSDHYLLPEGPAWESFLIKVPERRIRQLPEMLDGAPGRKRGVGIARAASVGDVVQRDESVQQHCGCRVEDAAGRREQARIPEGNARSDDCAVSRLCDWTRDGTRRGTGRDEGYGKRPCAFWRE